MRYGRIFVLAFLGLFVTFGVVRADTEMPGYPCSNLGTTRSSNDIQHIIACLKDHAGNSIWKSMTPVYVLGDNVGIGTVAPGAKMQVSAGNSSFALFGPNASWGGKLFVGAGTNQGVASTAQVISTDGNIHIDPAPGKNMYLGYFQARDIFLNPNGGNVGIGTMTAQAKLDVVGEIRPGNSGAACSAANEGAMRYNSATKVFEGCNGTLWQAISGASGLHNCTHRTYNSGSWQSTVTCNPGEIVTGGGCDNTWGGSTTVRSYPVAGGWYCLYGAAGTTTAHAICCTP